MEVTKVDGMYDSNDHWEPGTDVYCKIAEEDGSPIWRKRKIWKFLTVGEGIDGVTRKSKVILKVEAAGKGGGLSTVQYEVISWGLNPPSDDTLIRRPPFL
jgi:hypothetical protein